MYNLIEGIRICAVMLYPLIPDSAEKIMTQICLPENKLQLKSRTGATPKSSDLITEMILR